MLRDALRHFARRGGGSLDTLIGLLRDLPADVSQVGKAGRLADDIADQVVAARAVNPLIDGVGTPLDPARLLGTGGRTTVSVVNLSGLPNLAAQRDFVGRLMMALFTHIKRHPATAARPVLGLLAIDEAHNFAPSGSDTPSGAAAMALARQARKYGLGLAFATQAPKDIDNRIVGNCTTQLFGKISAPTQLQAAREMLASRGGSGRDLGAMLVGTFYLATEGAAPTKLRASLCLSHHPANPPTEDEVIARATRPLAAAE